MSKVSRGRCISSRFCSVWAFSFLALDVPFLTTMLVWLLRSWKLQQLELLGLDEKGETAQHQGSSAVEQAPAAPRRLGRLLAYVDSMAVVKRV